MIFNDLFWLKSKICFYKKNLVFWLWVSASLWVLTKIWWFYVLFIVYVYFTTTFMLFQKNPQIVFKESKTSVIIGYLRVNILLMMENAKFEKNFVYAWFFFYVFRVTFGFSFKILKTSISMFDCFFDEYKWASIGDKKMSRKVLVAYVKKSLSRALFKEFVKSRPSLSEVMTFNIRGRKKKIHIVILNKK